MKKSTKPFSAVQDNLCTDLPSAGIRWPVQRGWQRSIIWKSMAWWRGPLDLAIQLRGYEALMVDISERPAFVHDLLRFITEQRCRW